MSIRPNIRIYQEAVKDIINNSSIPITNLPNIPDIDFIDSDPIDIIHNQPLSNNISTENTTPFKDDIQDMVKLLGMYCQEDSINKIKELIKSIHEKLNSKPKRTIKSWVRKLANLHPKIDEYIKNNLDYFKNPYSEVMGTNTIMYYADTSSIDIMFWAKKPLFLTNEVEWFLDPWPSPSYLKESIREKLPQDVVEFIMKGNHITTTNMRRNLIYDATRTTEDLTGREIVQTRPIEYNVAHGVSLNNDWYHQNYRILDGERNKFWGKHNAISKMNENGYFVHVLFNYIEPLLQLEEANSKSIELKAPIGVEETFPRGYIKGKVNIAHNGQAMGHKYINVNDSSLNPEELII